MGKSDKKRDHEYEDPEEKERRKAAKKAEKVSSYQFFKTNYYILLHVNTSIMYLYVLNRLQSRWVIVMISIHSVILI